MDDGLRWFDHNRVGAVREPPPLREARPGLEYQHVFDQCALQAQRGGGAVLLVASSSFYARQLLGRLEGCQTRLVVQAQLSSPCGEDGSIPLPWWEGVGEGEKAAPETVIWAEPELGSGEQVAPRLSRLLSLDGRLYIVTSGRLARFLPEWRRPGSPPAAHPAGLWRTQSWLRQAGLAVEAVYGFHSPASVVWTWAAGLADGLGRGDLADRCLFQMRAAYVSRGWPALVTPVRMVVAKWT